MYPSKLTGYFNRYTCFNTILISFGVDLVYMYNAHAIMKIPHSNLGTTDVICYCKYKYMYILITLK